MGGTNESVITRCDECPYWRWEHTNVYAIGEGKCLRVRKYPDGPDRACSSVYGRKVSEVRKEMRVECRRRKSKLLL